MKRFFSYLKVILSIYIFLILSGCGTSGGAPEPIEIELAISSTKNLNPDIDDRASPIVIRVYQLTQIDTFNNSDFFALYENDKTLLVNDLTFREEFEIKPDQSITKPFQVFPSGKHIAVLAAFRDLDKAQWKAILEIDPLDPDSLKITLEEYKVSISTNSDD